MDQLTRLAHQARAGDQKAFRAFVEATYDQVWRTCVALVGEQDAGDFAQETFVRAARALRGFRGESTARVWLLAIARHVCLDELRARTRQRRRGELFGPGAEAPGAADPSAEATAMDLLARLSPERRTAFVLTQVLGLSYQEAAEVCECPVGTLRSRVARARAELLGSLGISGPAKRARRIHGYG